MRGNDNYSFIRFVGSCFYDFLLLSKNKNINRSVLLNQIYFTGLEAFVIIAVIALILAALIIHQGYQLLGPFGQTVWVYKFLASVLFRDIGPFITALVILTRSGTAISTELGCMSINKEIDALKTMGTTPISYLITPRILGMTLSLTILVLYFSIIGILGGYFVFNFLRPLTFDMFFGEFIKVMGLIDIGVMLFKAIFSGFAMALICSFHGLNVKNSITEIPQQNIRAVMHSIYAIFIINGLGTLMYLALV